MRVRSYRLRWVHAAAWTAIVALTSFMQSAAAQSRGDGNDSRNPPPPTLTVSGRAEISAEPDRAVVRLGVVGEGVEASAAQDQVNRAMEQVLEAVTGLDVPERSVRTEELSLYPIYSNEQPRPAQEQQEPRITGYRASNVVSVELDDLSRIGDVIDAGIEAGANQLQGISFQLRDDIAARSRALREAVQDARAQAEVLADAMDLRIRGVSQVIAGDYNLQPPMPGPQARFALSEMAATSVQPGQVNVSASVTVIFLLREEAGRQ
jgi:uncharacterized protein